MHHGLVKSIGGKGDILFFDGYVGFSYLSSAFIRVDATYSLMPNELYEDSFATFHQRFRLPDLAQSKEVRRLRDANEEPTGGDEEEVEMMSLLDTVAS